MNEISVVFGDWEGLKTGLQFSNAGETISNYTYWIGIGMLLISGIFWFFLGLVLDAVLPKKYGDSFMQ